MLKLLTLLALVQRILTSVTRRLRLPLRRIISVQCRVRLLLVPAGQSHLQKLKAALSISFLGRAVVGRAHVVTAHLAVVVRLLERLVTLRLLVGRLVGEVLLVKVRLGYVGSLGQVLRGIA